MEERGSGNDKKHLDKLISILPGHQLDLEIVKSAFLEHDSVAVLVADDDGNYLYVNPAATNIFGYTETEFLLMNIRDIRMSSGGNPIKQYKSFVSMGVSAGIFQFFDKYDQPKIGLYRASRIADDINLSLMFDVTDQFNFFDDVIDQFNEQSDVLNNLPSISYRFHHRNDGTTLFSFISENITKVLRLPEQRPSTSWSMGEMIHDEDLPKFMEASMEAISKVKPFIFRGRIRLGDGSISEFEARSYPVKRSDEIVFYGTLYLV